MPTFSERVMEPATVIRSLVSLASIEASPVS